MFDFEETRMACGRAHTSDKGRAVQLGGEKSGRKTEGRRV